MKFSIFILFFILTFCGFAQEHKKYVREGNKQYEKNNFIEAEKNYQKALEKKSESYESSFNLGDAYYKQGKYAEAASQFELLSNKTNDKETKSKAYHNLGNSLLKDKKNKQDQEQQPKPDQISKEDAQRLLEALNNDERKIQDKLKKKKEKGVKVEIDKDW